MNRLSRMFVGKGVPCVFSSPITTRIDRRRHHRSSKDTAHPAVDCHNATHAQGTTDRVFECSSFFFPFLFPQHTPAAHLHPSHTIIAFVATAAAAPPFHHHPSPPRRSIQAPSPNPPLQSLSVLVGRPFVPLLHGHRLLLLVAVRLGPRRRGPRRDDLACRRRHRVVDMVWLGLRGPHTHVTVVFIGLKLFWYGMVWGVSILVLSHPPAPTPAHTDMTHIHVTHPSPPARGGNTRPSWPAPPAPARAAPTTAPATYVMVVGIIRGGIMRGEIRRRVGGG